MPEPTAPAGGPAGPAPGAPGPAGGGIGGLLAEAEGPSSAVVVCRNGRHHPVRVAEVVETGADVVSLGANARAVAGVLALDGWARARDRVVVAGVSFEAGLAFALACLGARSLDVVEEVHVAVAGPRTPGAAGWAAAEGWARRWSRGAWRWGPAATGRQLCWFPDPFGGLDTYLVDGGSLPLVVGTWPGLRAATARRAMDRRERIRRAVVSRRRGPAGRGEHESRCGPPDAPDLVLGERGDQAALWVEVRGWHSGRASTVLVGARGSLSGVEAALCGEAVAACERGAPRGAHDVVALLGVSGVLAAARRGGAVVLGFTGPEPG